MGDEEPGGGGGSGTRRGEMVEGAVEAWMGILPRLLVQKLPCKVPVRWHCLGQGAPRREGELFVVGQHLAALSPSGRTSL